MLPSSSILRWVHSSLCGDAMPLFQHHINHHKGTVKYETWTLVAAQQLQILELRRCMNIRHLTLPLQNLELALQVLILNDHIDEFFAWYYNVVVKCLVALSIGKT
uniref:Uncharacterized protein n=1 Tax=Physcomitrium patens TaxID=3218 RepID=A0A2K1JM66_PHYPA|nr:hypothetical protein PHYPA_017296 [Physcomitrium patens]